MQRKLVIRPGGPHVRRFPDPPPPPPPPPTGFGIPFGPFGGYDGSASLEVDFDRSIFTYSTDSVNTGNVITRLNSARDLGIKIRTAMTGGATNLNFAPGGNKFDFATWRNRMLNYKTSAIRAAIASAWEDKVWLGEKMVDEPNNQKWDPDSSNAKRIAGEGVFSKQLLDVMAGVVKDALGAFAPAGVDCRYDFHTAATYQVLDFSQYQYSYRLLSDPTFGTPAEFRDKGLAQSALDGVNTLWSMNVTDGGTTPQTPMTAAQILDAGMTLGPTGRCMTMWQMRHESEATVPVFTVEEKLDSMRSIRDALKVLPVNLDWRRGQ